MHASTDQVSAELDARRRRAIFRSWHRGMREMDLILGKFADEHVFGLNEADLAQYEALLEVPDGEFLKWLTGERPVPEENDTPLFRTIRATTSQF